MIVKRTTPKRGDVYWIYPSPVAGREMKDRHRFVVISPGEINGLGVCMTVAIACGGNFTRNVGLVVPVSGHDTSGAAICNQVRAFDIEARVRSGSARYIETIDKDTADEIVARVISAIDPAP